MKGVMNMLLEFRAKNYKSFRDEMVFSMIAEPQITEMDYSLLNESGGSQTCKGISTAVIYGPNASGKSNIIGAMDTFKQIMLRGNIRNTEVTSSNIAASNLERIPNCSDAIHNPLTFSISFIEKGYKIEYILVADIGGFLDSRYQRRVLSEQLKVNGEMIFTRERNVAFGSFKPIEAMVKKGLEQAEPLLIELANSNLIDDELFLMHGFKEIFCNGLVSIISNWLTNKFIIVYRSDEMRMVPVIEKHDNKLQIISTLEEASRAIGVSSNALGYSFSDK
jgi:hypothetical protein